MTSKINVYVKEGKYYADAKEIDNEWTVELDSIKILACENFLAELKAPTKACVDTYSGTYEFVITFLKDSQKIIKNCYCPECLSFWSFRDILFSEKIEEAKLRKLNFIFDVSKKLSGKWYLNPYIGVLQNDDYIVLKRRNDFDKEYCWDFGVDESFKSICNNFLDLTYSKKYKLDNWGDLILEIERGFAYDKNGIYSFMNDGALFIIDTVTDETLKLKFVFRN